MALAIKAIPTLYGEDAIRFREEIERVDRECDARPERDITADPRYATMKAILSKAKLFSICCICSQKRVQISFD